MNTLYYGEYLLPIALKKAEQILDTHNLDVHPDYVFVDIPNGKKQIGVEEISPILLRVAEPSVFESGIVVVINHFDSMTVSAQNKLLLTLESGAVTVLGVACTDAVLPTVKSRMAQVVCRPVPFEVFCEKTDLSGTTAHLIYYISGGCCECVAGTDYVECLKRIYDCCHDRPGDLLEELFLVKEKDTRAQVVTDCGLRRDLIRVFQYCVLEDIRAGNGSDFADTLLDAEKMCLKSFYTKDDLFLLVVQFMEYRCQKQKGG